MRVNHVSRRSFLSASAAWLGAASLPWSTGAMTRDRVIQTRLGQVRGLQDGQVFKFLNLRYGAAPIGALRFTPPQLPEPWAGVYDATQLPPICPQEATPQIGNGRAVPKYRQDEDCLFLNIFTPAPDQQRRPVLFRIHGGGYDVGSANEMDGGKLAVQGDIVVVAPNYRLSLFGFIDLSSLDKSLAGSASNGFRDQIAALRWVKDNIADYGGDPENVTIEGLSAGGGSVLSLLAAPAANGLFHRGMAHSPGIGAIPPQDYTQQLAAALKVGREHLLERLRALPAKDLLALQKSVGVTSSGGCIDGVVITRDYVQAIHERGAEGVSLITGSTHDEGTIFPALGMPTGTGQAIAGLVVGGDPTKYLANLRAAYPKADAAALDVQVWDDFFRHSALRGAVAATEAGPGGWLYRFDLPTIAEGGKLGATHGSDIPFIYNDFSTAASGEWGALFDGKDLANQKLAEQLSNTFLAFVRTGDPNGFGLPHWPKYNKTGRASLVVDARSRIVRGLDDPRLKLWGDA